MAHSKPQSFMLAISHFFRAVKLNLVTLGFLTPTPNIRVLASFPKDLCKKVESARVIFQSRTAFVKFVVNRSRRHATSLCLPPVRISDSEDVCPGLKALSFHCELMGQLQYPSIPGLIRKWKHLESLSLGCDKINMKELLSQISIHCKNFCRLQMSFATIDKEIVMEFVNLLLNLKYLTLRKSKIGKEDLIMLLLGCKELVGLDVNDCEGFYEGDKEISKLGSHIRYFSCKGSRVIFI